MSQYPRFFPRLQRAVLEVLESRQLLAQSTWAFPASDGHMIYQPRPLGDHIQEFSMVGYMGGTMPIPTVPAKVTVNAPDNDPLTDETALIQNAINSVQGMPLDANGFRGAVLLGPGTYHIGTNLSITASGVVLRGSGAAATTLHGTGTGQRTLVQVNGSGTRSTVSGTTKILDKYVPIGAISFTVENTTGLAVGDQVVIHRPSTQQWINDMGMNLLDNPWTAGGRDINMDRTITRIEGNVITLDAGIAQALELKYTDAAEGDNQIFKYTANGRLTNVGVEFIGGDSDFVSPTDDNHPWTFINIDGSQNAWARSIQSQHFGYAAVYVTGGSKYATVQDSQCLDPISVITGGNRYPFNIDDSSHVLFRNLYVREGRHDYVQGSTVTGPNVFVDSRADNAHADSGPHHRYSTYTLWDNIDVNGNAINIQDRGNSGSGHGHAGANQVVWNSAANSFIVQSPATAQNWLIGSIGNIGNGGGIGFHTQGLHESSGPGGTGANVSTRSLYYAHLDPRLRYENYLQREIRLGDSDDYLDDGASDDVFAEAAWKSAIDNALANPVAQFDVTGAAQHVPFTFNFGLNPGEYVVSASLSLGIKSNGSSTSSDRIYFENPTRSYSYTDLGIAAPNSTAGGRVIDLTRILPALQDGKLNVAISGNIALDWATLNIQTANSAVPTQVALSPVADAYIRDGTSAATNFGTAATIDTKSDVVNNNRESFLRFNLSSITGAVTNAYIRLVPTSVGIASASTPGIAEMFQQLAFVSDDAWTEAAINWNNRPGAGAVAREFIAALNAPQMIDITSLVQSELAGDKNLSLRLNSITTNTSGQVIYASKENGNIALRPVLVIQTFSGLSPVADAYVRDGTTANTNFGTSQDLVTVKGTTNNNRDTYLKFDTTSLVGAPAAATLRLVSYAVGGGIRNTTSFVATDSWTEGGITWNNKPASGAVLGSFFPFQATALTSNVTSQVAGDGLLSLRVFSDTTAASAPLVQFGSRENTNPLLRPLLVFTNQVPTITTIPNQSGSAGSPTPATWFGIWDAETPLNSLNVTAVSSNTTLLPNANIALAGSGVDRTFVLTAAAGQFGSTNVTITVTDAQGQFAQTTFAFNVTNAITINGDQESAHQADIFRVVRNGSFLDVFRNDLVNPVLRTDFSTAPQVLINGLGGGDIITVDYSVGSPIPASGVSFDGGDGTDQLRIVTGGGSDAVTVATNAITIGSPLAYTTTEQLELNLGSGSDALNVSGTSATSMTLNVSGGGTLATAGLVPAFADLNVNGATLDLNGVSQAIDELNGSGTILNSGPAAATLSVNSGAFTGILGAGTNTLGLTKNGAGTLILGGANTYTGATTINDGALRITHPTALGSTSGNTTIGGGALVGRLEIVGGISVAENFTLGNRTGGGGGNFAPHIQSVSGDNTLTGNFNLTSGGSYWTIQSDAGKLTLSGDLANAVTSNTRVLFLRGAGAGEITGRIRQADVSVTQLQKEDAGTWTISGADNNYTGDTLVNDGTLRVSGSIAASSSVQVAAGASFIAGASQALTSLVINNGANAFVEAGGNKVLTVGSLVIDIAGRLDLADNSMIIDYTGASPIDLIKASLGSGFNGGGWNGVGIHSSVAALGGGFSLGYAEASVLSLTSFAGQPVDSTALLLKFTYAGDTNLDSQVDVTDLGKLATNWQLSGNWTEGNFNYNTLVEIGDLGMLATNWQRGVPVAPVPALRPSTRSRESSKPIRASVLS